MHRDWPTLGAAAGRDGATQISITGAETKQQGEETARGTQLQGGMAWQKRLFSQAGGLQGLLLGHQKSSKLLYFGLSV